MLARDLATELAGRVENEPVVTLLGPRQSGKTTLARQLFANYTYRNLERPDVRLDAELHPLEFLTTSQHGMILDEVQRVPSLLSYIQTLVDDDPRPGRFILTGSQNILLLESVSQTLAGRTALLNLVPLSITELLERKPLNLSDLGQACVDDRLMAAPQRNIWETLFSGFFPRIHDQCLNPTKWLADYTTTYVERDLQGVLRTTDRSAFHRFLRGVAARTGTELNLSHLASDVGITQPTAKAWLGALETAYLVFLLPPYHSNYRKRLRKRPKLHMIDTGLICYLLQITSAKQLQAHPLRGAIFESYVAAEVLKSQLNTGRKPTLFHWRDASNREIDLIAEVDGRPLPIEAKSGLTLPSDAADTIRWWLSMASEAENAAIIYGGDERKQREHIDILPWYLT